MFSLDGRFPYFETSAATGQNVAKAVETLLDMVMNRMQQVMDGEGPMALHNGDTLKLGFEENDSGSGGGAGSGYLSRCGC